MRRLTQEWAERSCSQGVTIHIPPSQPLPAGELWSHYHNRPEIFFQLKGANHFSLQDGTTVTARAGDIAIMPPRTAHNERREKVRGYYAHLCMSLQTEAVGCHFGGLPPFGPSTHNICLAAVRRPTPRARFIREILEELVRVHRKSGESSASFQGLQTTFLAYIAEAFGDQGRDPELPPAVADCRRIIHQNLNNSALSVASLATELRCHPDHLSRLYREVTGETLRGYIIRHRMLLASEVMATTRTPVQEIAHLCGYTDHAYFSACFRKFSGKSPSSYRRYRIDPNQLAD